MNRIAMTTLGALGLAPCLLACGSSSDGASPVVSVDEPLTIEASPATRAELGVAAWGASVDGSGTAVIHGYDAGSKPIIEFRHAVGVPDDQHRVVAISVSGAHGTAAMQTHVTRSAAVGGDESGGAKVDVDIHVDSNTFVDHDDARRVLSLLDADTRAHEAHATGGGGPSGGALVQSLRPADISLVNGYCADLNSTCMAKLVITVGGFAGGASACGLTVADTAIALICDVATAETGVGPLACTAAAAPGISASAATCAVGVAAGVDGADGVREKCLKKCGT